MIRHIIMAFAAVALLAVAASAAPLTYISSTGDNANPCSRTAPCRTFAGALSKTDANGDLVVLDSGVYGPLYINKSVRVTAVGVYAGTGLAVTSVAAIVSIGPSDVVVLRGLNITGTYSGGDFWNYWNPAIDYTTGGTLHVEDCTIENGNAGIAFRGAGRLFVKDSIIRGNYDIGILVGMYNCRFTGIPVLCGAGTAIASIDHCKIEGLYQGVSVVTDDEDPGKAFAKVTLRDSTISGGVFSGGSGSQVNVYDCQEISN